MSHGVYNVLRGPKGRVVWYKEHVLGAAEHDLWTVNHVLWSIEHLLWAIGHVLWSIYIEHCLRSGGLVYDPEHISMRHRTCFYGPKDMLYGRWSTEHVLYLVVQVRWSTHHVFWFMDDNACYVVHGTCFMDHRA